MPAVVPLPVGEEARRLVEAIGRDLWTIIHEMETIVMETLAARESYLRVSNTYDRTRLNDWSELFTGLPLSINQQLLARGYGTEEFTRYAEQIMREAYQFGWAYSGVPYTTDAARIAASAPFSPRFSPDWDVPPSVLESLSVIAGDLTGVFTDVRNRALRYPVDAYARLTAKWAGLGSMNVLSREQIRRGLIDDFATHGIPPFVDRAGRQWSAGSYADMATRTSIMRAQQTVALARMRAAGIRFVSILGNANACELCAKWFGKVLEYGGGPLGTYPRNMSVENETAPVTDFGTEYHLNTRQGRVSMRSMTVRVDGHLEEARLQGLFHPNCYCIATAYVPGMDVPTQANSFDPDAAAARERMRELERRTRTNRRRLAGAELNGDQVAAQRYKRAIARDRGELAGLADDYDVARQYGREGVGWDRGVWSSRVPKTAKVATAARPKAITSARWDEMVAGLPPGEGQYLDVTEGVRKVLDGRYGSLLDFRLEQARLTRDDVWLTSGRKTGLSLEVNGSALVGTDGSHAGDVVFRINDVDGHRWVEYDLMNLASEARGTGFSTAFAQTTGRWWAENGVEAVRTHAALQDGGWAWANAGFQWDPQKWEETRGDLMYRIDAFVEAGPDHRWWNALSEGDKLLLGELRENLGNYVPGDPQLFTPQDIAQMTGDAGNLGEVFLRGSSWYGIIPVPPRTYSDILKAYGNFGSEFT